MRNAYARIIGVRTGSVTEEEFAGVLDRFAPIPGPGRDVPGRGGMAQRRALGTITACPTSPLTTATTRCPIAAAAAAASSCPRSASGSGTASATTRRCTTSARSSAARSISASPTSTSPTTTARPPARPRATSAASCAEDLRPYRDELIISSKAGYDMWPGPYGEWGSRKYLIASLDPSLQRMGLDYVDIFYSHRFDPDTPLEETIGALDRAVRQGKALYAGISSYSAERTKEAVEIAKALGTPLLIHQPCYSLLNRWIEPEVLDTCGERARHHRLLAARAGHADRPLPRGIPADSRAAKDFFLKRDFISEENMARIRALNEIAQQRGQALAQMALAWVLRDPRVTSALIGASCVSSSRPTSPRWTTSSSPTRSWPRSTGRRSTPASTSGGVLARMKPPRGHPAVHPAARRSCGFSGSSWNRSGRRAEMKLPYRPELATMDDVVHGGAIASLIDTAGMASCGPRRGAGVAGGATVTLNVSYVAAARGQDLTAVAA